MLFERWLGTKRFVFVWVHSVKYTHTLVCQYHSIWSKKPWCHTHRKWSTYVWFELGLSDCAGWPKGLDERERHIGVRFHYEGHSGLFGVSDDAVWLEADEVNQRLRINVNGWSWPALRTARTAENARHGRGLQPCNVQIAQQNTPKGSVYSQEQNTQPSLCTVETFSVYIHQLSKGYYRLVLMGKWCGVYITGVLK